jgi:hypothetical protein
MVEVISHKVIGFKGTEYEYNLPKTQEVGAGVRYLPVEDYCLLFSAALPPKKLWAASYELQVC